MNEDEDKPTNSIEQTNDELKKLTPQQMGEVKETIFKMVEDMKKNPDKEKEVMINALNAAANKASDENAGAGGSDENAGAPSAPAPPAPDVGQGGGKRRSRKGRKQGGKKKQSRKQGGKKKQSRKQGGKQKQSKRKH